MLIKNGWVGLLEITNFYLVWKRLSVIGITHERPQANDEQRGLPSEK
jgi:hypothetical protein